MEVDPLSIKLSASNQNTLRNLTPQETITVPWYVSGASFSPDGTLFATVGERDDNSVVLRVWDIQAKSEVFTTIDQSVVSTFDFCYDISFSPDGKKLAIFHDYDCYMPTLVSFSYAGQSDCLTLS